MIKKLSLLILAIMLTACQNNDTITTDYPVSLDRTDNMVSYIADKPEVQGYLAMPEGDGPFPGVILIHEWWGLNDQIFDMADQYAEAGYAALAVDLYEGKASSDPAVARELSTLVREDKEAAFINLNAGLSFLKNKEQVHDEKLASVGWCFGGGWSYEIAKNNLGTKASVIYYGQFNPEDDLSIMRTTILGHFGEDDRSIKVDDVNTFQANLNTLEGDHAVYIYPNSGHGFSNPNNNAYNAEASEVAWQRTLNFLESELE